jgi:UDPglucose 6-dehydrogenase
MNKNILCIGAGYVGGPTMAVIADRCPDYSVTVADINAARTSAWNSDHLPIYEPGLDALVKRNRGRNLFFSTEIEKSIKKCDIIFVSVNTPTKTFGKGAGMAADLQYWEKTARLILENATRSKIVIEKSTLPVRTAAAMGRILHSKNNGIHFDILSNPEFMAEGSAVKDLENPDRVLIGSSETMRGKKARDVLVKIYEHWVSRERIVTSNIWSSELSKLVANAFLAQRISSINSISALCEKTDANVLEVAHAIGMDKRIGSKFLNASVGFGGSCFKKDILHLVYICRNYGLNEVANYWESVIQINKYQQERFIMNMLKVMFNTLADKRICLFGFAFKANTSDTRESPAIEIAKRLLEEHAKVIITDPQALDNVHNDLAQLNSAKKCVGNIILIKDPYKAAKACDAIAVMTEWNIYNKLNYKRIYNAMNKPAFLFDGRNILDHKKCYEIGFNVYPIGKPPLVHFKAC